nr:S-protein homolog 5-like [Coffea arabica]
MTKTSLLPMLLILSFYFLQGHGLLDRYTVKVFSGLPPDKSPVFVHCQSSDDDLGFRELGPQGEFSWSFKQNFFETTLYDCRFQFGSDILEFDVFNKHLAKQICGRDNICFWYVKVDGIYWAKDSNLNDIYLYKSWQ